MVQANDDPWEPGRRSSKHLPESLGVGRVPPPAPGLPSHPVPLHPTALHSLTLAQALPDVPGLVDHARSVGKIELLVGGGRQRELHTLPLHHQFCGTPAGGGDLGGEDRWPLPSPTWLLGLPPGGAQGLPPSPGGEGLAAPDPPSGRLEPPNPVAGSLFLIS